MSKKTRPYEIRSWHRGRGQFTELMPLSTPAIHGNEPFPYSEGVDIVDALLPYCLSYAMQYSWEELDAVLDDVINYSLPHWGYWRRLSRKQIHRLKKKLAQWRKP